MIFKNKFTSFLALFILFSFSASAKTLYVDGTTGNDATAYAANDASNPWRTIGRAAWGSTDRNSPNAAQAAQAGDVVLIASGTYSFQGSIGNRWGIVYNPANSGAAGNPITFQAQGTVSITAPSALSPVIGCSGRNYIVWLGPFLIDEANIDVTPDTGPVVLHSSTGCQIIGATIDGDVIAPYNDNHPGIRLEACSSCRVANNTIFSFHKQNDNHNGALIMLYGTSNSIIENNYGYDAGSGVFFKDYASAAPQSGNIVRYNWFENSVNECFVWSMFAGNNNRNDVYQNVCKDANIGARFIGARNDVITNNVFVNVNYPLYMNSPDLTTGVRFYNNIIHTANTVIQMQAGPLPADSNIDVEHNTYYSFTRFYSGANGNMDFATYRSTYPDKDQTIPASIANQDPLFVNLSAEDFRLQAQSPARAIGLDILDLDSDGVTSDIVPAGTYITGSESIGLVTQQQAPPQDTAPPTLTNGAPTGTLTAGTTQTILSLTTNEVANCRYSTTSGVAYSSMANTFTTTGSTSHSTTVSGLANGNSYSYYIRCQDAAPTPNANTNDFAITFSVALPDIVPPVISLIASSGITQNAATITWTTDEASDTQIEYGLTTAYGSSTALNSAMVVSHSQQITALSANTLYHYRVLSRDAAGNLVTSGDFTFTTAAPDTTPPSQVTGLAAAAISPSQINLAWNAATDNVGVTGYRIYRGGVEIAASATTSYPDTGLSANTSYVYTISAYDSAGNLGAQSASASATTQAAPVPQTGIVYLSDLNWTNAVGPVQRDVSVSLGPLTLAGIVYPKGLGTHSPSNITFSIPNGCQYFVSDIGIDDIHSGENGNAEFKVYLDSILAYSSGAMMGPSPTRTINLSLGTSSQIKLELDPLGGISRDAGDWADARFACSQPQANLEGDINSDRNVNMQDILMIVNDFGKTSGFNPAVDVGLPLNSIDLFDVMIVVRNWGRIA